MVLENGDTVIVQNTSISGELIDEGFATIVKQTKQLDYYMVKFIGEDGLYLRFIPTENKVQV